MKKLVFPFYLSLVMFLGACAMQEDVLILNDKINRMNDRTSEIYKEMSLLQEQLTKTRHELRNIDVVKSVEVISKKQADMGIQLEDIKQELMRLQGSIEQQENRLQELVGRSQSEVKGLTEKMQGLLEQLRSLQVKVADLEKAVSDVNNNFRNKISDLEKAMVRKDKAVDKEAKPDMPPAAKPAIAAGKTKIKGKKSAKEDYEEAYKLYEENAYRSAREKFRAFLNEHPDSELVGNARFWLGDCYYQQERYEEAILEYEKVVCEHKGAKVPAALLKQGLAFHKLGDTETAKLLMKKLVDEYPKSQQAESARAKLKKWGEN